MKNYQHNVEQIFPSFYNTAYYSLEHAKNLTIVTRKELL